MSGIEPGRPKIEWREAAYVAVGDRILSRKGVEWRVSRIALDEGPPIRFYLRRDINKVSKWDCQDDDMIRVRNL